MRPADQEADNYVTLKTVVPQSAQEEDPCHTMGSHTGEHQGCWGNLTEWLWAILVASGNGKCQVAKLIYIV